MTYYPVVTPALLLLVLSLVMGFSAQTATAIAQGKSPYTAHARLLITVFVSLVIATIVLPVPQRWLIHLAPVMLVGTLGFQSSVPSPLGRSEGGNVSWVKVGPIIVQSSEFLEFTPIVFLASTVSKLTSKRGDWKTISLAADLPILTVLGTVMLSRDMGTVMVVVVSVLGAMWVASLSKHRPGGLVVLAVPTTVLLVLSNPMRTHCILAVLPGTSKGSDEFAPG